MEERRFVTLDGNEATANIAHLCNEVMAIYPDHALVGLGRDAGRLGGRRAARTSSAPSPTLSKCRARPAPPAPYTARCRPGPSPRTFTASQGLLLMIPNMFKIAGELTATVFHVTARTVATHALSIFGDHSDVMACRSTGWAMLAAGSVQEAQDMALIAHAATLEARVPFLHFFDGFRISHEVNKIEQLTEDDVRSHDRHGPGAASIAAGRCRRSGRMLRGTAQNPDVFFQAREACNPFYTAVPGIVQKTMDKFARLFGRQYHLFDYIGPPRRRARDRGHGLGLRRGRGDGREARAARARRWAWSSCGCTAPSTCQAFVSRAAARRSRRSPCLDRTKEPGALGEPLYQDVLTALAEELARACRCGPAARSSAAATACRPRNSRRRMVGGASTTSWTSPAPSGTSPWASTTT